MRQSNRCQCFDPGCNIHHDGQCKERATETLYRVDQQDFSGTPFCEGCADDAFSSDLFTTNDDPEELDEADTNPTESMQRTTR